MQKSHAINQITISLISGFMKVYPNKSYYMSLLMSLMQLILQYVNVFVCYVLLTVYFKKCFPICVFANSDLMNIVTQKQWSHLAFSYDEIHKLNTY